MRLVTGKQVLMFIQVLSLSFFFVSCKSKQAAADKSREEQLEKIEERQREKEKELQEAYEKKLKRIYDVQDDIGKERLRKARSDQKKWSTKGKQKKGFFLFRWFSKDKARASCR